MEKKNWLIKQCLGFVGIIIADILMIEIIIEQDALVF